MQTQIEEKALQEDEQLGCEAVPCNNIIWYYMQFFLEINDSHHTGWIGSIID